MKKSILAAFLLFSHIASHANTCSLNGLEKLFSDSPLEIPRLADKYTPTAKIEDEFTHVVRKKIQENHLPELTPMYESIDEAYRLGRVIDNIKRDIRLYEISDNLPFPSFVDELKAQQAAVEKQLTELNDAFLVKMKEIYDLDNIPSKLVDSGGYKTLLLDFDAPPVKGPAFNFYKRVHSRFGLKHVTLSLKENAENMSRGFYSPSEARMEIGPGQAMRLLDDYINTTGKHETRHAIFNSHRSKGIASIFDTQFIASDAKLLNQQRYYDQYMSAEELYTFSTDLQTLAQSLKGDALTDPQKLLGLLEQTYEKSQGLQTVAKTQKELTEGFYQSARLAIQEKSLGRIQGGKLKDGNIQLAIQDDYGRFSVLTLVSDEHKTLYNRYGETVTELSQKQEAYLTRRLLGQGVDINDLNARAPDGLTEVEINMLKTFEADFNAQSQTKRLIQKKEKQEAQLVGIIETRMKDLHRLSSVQLEEAKKLDEMILTYARNRESASAEDVEAIRKHMFETSKLVKEKYKGYALRVYPDTELPAPAATQTAKTATPSATIPQSIEGSKLYPGNKLADAAPSGPIRIKPSGEKFTLSETSMDLSKELYVSLDDRGHIYLMAHGKRFEGYPLDKNRLRDVKDGTRIRPGMFFGIALPPEKLQIVREAMEKNVDKFGLSCMHATCKVLQQSGIEIEGHRPGMLLRIRPILTGLEEGKVTVDGAPAKIRTFATSDVEVKKFLDTTAEKMKKVESDAYTLYGGPAGIIGGVVIATGVAGYQYFQVEEVPKTKDTAAK